MIVVYLLQIRHNQNSFLILITTNVPIETYTIADHAVDCIA
jgi:hypothetical protein